MTIQMIRLLPRLLLLKRILIQQFLFLRLSPIPSHNPSLRPQLARVHSVRQCLLPEGLFPVPRFMLVPRHPLPSSALTGPPLSTSGMGWTRGLCACTPRARRPIMPTRQWPFGRRKITSITRRAVWLAYAPDSTNILHNNNNSHRPVYTRLVVRPREELRIILVPLRTPNGWFLPQWWGLSAMWTATHRRMADGFKSTRRWHNKLNRNIRGPITNTAQIQNRKNL